jgi:hypothetical protein
MTPIADRPLNVRDATTPTAQVTIQNVPASSESAMTRRSFLMTGIGTVASALLIGATGYIAEMNRREEKRWKTASLGNFEEFCQHLRRNNFGAAAKMAQDLARDAYGNGDFGKYFVWLSNQYVCDALRGDADSVLGLQSVLQSATNWGAAHKGYGDWLYAASLDLIYFSMLFFEIDPAIASTTFELVSYQKLRAMVPVKVYRLSELEYCCAHIFELSPASMIDVPEVVPSFLYCKVLAMRRQYKAALSLLQNNCMKDWATSKEVQVALELAQPFLMASLGEIRTALRKAHKVDISPIRDESAIMHMETVRALFRSIPDSLAHKISQQAKCGRHFLGYVLNGDCRFFLGGEPARKIRQDYASAALHGYSRPGVAFKGSSILCSSFKSLLK